MDLFCWINSVADGDNSGAETELVPTEILLEFLNQRRGAALLRKCLLRAIMGRIKENRIEPRRLKKEKEKKARKIEISVSVAFSSFPPTS